MSEKRLPPRSPEQRQAQAVRSLLPGSMGGRLANASPVAKKTGGTAAGGGSSGSAGSGGVVFARDRFVLAGATGDVTLTFLARAGSEHVYLNGLEQDEGTDWTRDSVTLTVLSAMAAAVGDVLEVRYAYLASQPGQIVETEEFTTSQTFAYTGGSQSFIVPPGVTQLLVEAEGAQGGSDAFTNPFIPATGGLGGLIHALIDVTPGETLAVRVGGTTGYNGGGPLGTGNGGATGGGASDVRRGSTLADRLVTAGGGGGAAQSAKDGGDGGASTGESGVVGGLVVDDVRATGGAGGTPTAGGAGGTNPPGRNGTDGALGTGGTGGGGASVYRGGGGGGGHYGGGGGASGDAFDAGAGGGGGSNGTTGTLVTSQRGIRAGHGRVVIRW